MKKKKFLQITAFCLLINTTSRAEVFEYEGIRYNTLTDTTAEVASYNDGVKGDIVIPDSVSFGDKRLKVTAIGRYAFSSWMPNDSSITSVKLPKGITSIGECAFNYQKGITAFDIPETVEYIGYNALNGTGLKTITMRHAPSEMLFGVFSECQSLETAIMPDDMTELPQNTFSNCQKLKTVQLPKTLRKICGNAFMNCKSLETFTMPDSLETIEGGPFWGCTNLREIHWNNAIKTLDGYMFWGCEHLEEIVLPSSLTKIPYSCFENCTGLRRITIPSTITEINYNAFTGCTALEQVVWDGVNITNLTSYVFKDCKSLKHLDIPETVTIIGNNAFEGSGLESIVFGPNIERIYEEAFLGCASLTDVYVRSAKLNSLSSWGNIFSNVSYYLGTLHVPEGQKNKFLHTEVWKNFCNIVEENISGKTYCLVNVECLNHEFQVNDGEKTMRAYLEIEKGERLTVSIPEEDIYSSVNRHRFLVGVLVNGEERLAEVVDGLLTIDAVEQDLNIEVVFDTYNVSLAIYQDKSGGLEFMTELHEETPITVMPAAGYKAMVKWGSWYKTCQWEPWYETYEFTTPRTFTLEGDNYYDQEINVSYKKP